VRSPFYNSPATPALPRPAGRRSSCEHPLFDGGFRYGAAGAQRALRESKAQLEGLLRLARSEVRAAFESVRGADDSLRSARQAARLAHQALDMSTLAYREGATNDLEVIDAERRARDADVRALGGRYRAPGAHRLLAASGRFPESRREVPDPDHERRLLAGAADRPAQAIASPSVSAAMAEPARDLGDTLPRTEARSPASAHSRGSPSRGE